MLSHLGILAANSRERPIDSLQCQRLLYCLCWRLKPVAEFIKRPLARSKICVNSSSQYKLEVVSLVVQVNTQSAAPHRPNMYKKLIAPRQCMAVRRNTRRNNWVEGGSRMRRGRVCEALIALQALHSCVNHTLLFQQTWIVLVKSAI